MDADTLQTRKMAETRLLMRAMDDPAFRAQLFADPRAAFEEELGIAFPSAAKFTVIEEAPDTVVLAIPKAPLREGELSDAELEGVAGGLTMQDVKDAMSSAWRSVKKALGGGSFEVSTERAVAGVRG